MSVISNSPELIRNGYQVIPITSEGVPLVNGFHETTYSIDDGLSWIDKFESASLALVCGKNNIYALDFDIDNIKLANRIKNALTKSYPGICIRQCNDPRFAVLFKASGELLKHRNGSSAKFKTPDGNVNGIELIGGKLLTLYGTHRKTLNVYRWSRDNNPLKIQSDSLVTISLNDINKIFNFYEKNVPNGYEKVSNSSFSRHKQENTFESVKLRKRYNDDEIDELLDKTNGDDYSSWIKVGQALHAQYNGNIEGLTKWDDWSKLHDGYEKGACQTKWKTFSTDGGVGIGSIAYEVKKTEISIEDEIDLFVKDHVLIERGQLVGKLSAKPAEAILKLDEAKLAYSNIGYNVESTTPTGKPTITWTPIMTIWSKRQDRQQCYDKQYVPLKKRIVKDFVQNTERKYWNSYIPPDIKTTSKTNLLHYFLDHVEYLFNDTGDMEWYLNWLAQIIQDPVNRFPVTPLHISTYHGTGRGWLTKIMGSIIGIQNTTTTNITNMTNEQGFTGFLNNSILCILDEVHQSDKGRFKINDRMKSLLSDDLQEINIKYGAQLTGVIFTRFFMMSNHIDALVIDEMDRRVEVFINRLLPKKNEYYETLTELERNSDFHNQVYTFLYEFPVDTNLLLRSRHTKARSILINSTKSNTALAFFEFKNIVGEDIYTENMMKQFMAHHITLHHPNDMSYYINDKEIYILERDYVQVSKLIKR